jgi:hypothetical protein
VADDWRDGGDACRCGERSRQRTASV